MTVQAVETTPKTFFVKNQKKVEDLEAEIAALEGKAQEDPEGEEEIVQPAPEEGEVQEDDKDLSTEESTFKKRYGDLRRYQQQKEKEYQAELEKLKKQLEGGQQLPTSKEAVEAWVKKYPDIAGIVKSLAGEQAKEQFAEIDRRTKELEEMREAAAYERAVAVVIKEHPDFHQISDSKDFHKWAEEQSSTIQKVIYDELDAKGLSSVLRLYKQEKGIKTAVKPKADNSAALSVSTRGGATAPRDAESIKWSESKVAKLTDAEFMKHEEEIMAAMREGNFAYDMKKSR